jgi:peptide/nickel transport system substrate-binding protein
MTHPYPFRSWSTPTVALALTFLAACGGSESRAPAAVIDSAAMDTTTNAINPVPREQLQDGGTLTWSLTEMPDNFNYYQLDGTLRDNADVMEALMPSAFRTDASGTPHWDRALLASEPLLVTEPRQVVTYEIHPDAVWADGEPITWEDFHWQWRATNGTNSAYIVAATQGWDSIESVEMGAHEREVVVTFARRYADWQSLFYLLYPQSTNRDPEAFNTGWLQQPLTSGGPFRLEDLSLTTETITLVRNERWWGPTPRLDRIVYRAVNADAQIDAVANGEMDFMDVGPNVNAYNRAQAIADTELRIAGGPNFRHLTINGTSELLRDVRVRRALAMGIDRAAIARAMLGPLGFESRPLNNHLFMTNQSGYQDNAAVVAYDPAAAGALLDEAGWPLLNGVRTRDGRPLEVNFVIPGAVPVSQQESELIQSMLRQIGVTVNIRVVPAQDFFDQYLAPGQFDFTVFSWIGTPFLSSARSIYREPTANANGNLDIQQNYARIGSTEIDRLYDEANAELDPDRRIALMNQVDTRLWELVHSLTLYQRPEIYVVREDLANFGAFAFQQPFPFEDMGWMTTAP